MHERLINLKFHPFVLALRKARKLLADIGPTWALRLNTEKKRALQEEVAKSATLEECIDFTRRHMATGSCQVPWEIKSAIEMIAATQPKLVCEIGTFDGGTTVLLSRFLPTVQTMICVDLFVRNKELLRTVTPASRRISFIDLPSYSAACIRKVERLLAGKPIDMLFIDGDHRYEGVKRDFLAYRKYVRNGGLVLFHDIVESRGGRAWTGGVPVFWREIAAHYPHREFVQTAGQDGFGIGVLTYDPSVPLPRAVTES